jgi:hypothetical protein
MVNTKETEIETKDLDNLPLFFKKIHWNKLTNINDELHLMNFNFVLQANIFIAQHSSRNISKTVNYKIFDNNAE